MSGGREDAPTRHSHRVNDDSFRSGRFINFYGHQSNFKL
jgi:hypothetical protein